MVRFVAIAKSAIRTWTAEMADHYLRKRYYEEVVPTLMTDFGFANVMQVPKIQKVVVNVGVGEALENAKALDASIDDMSIITGQRPVITRAKKSIANFKLREGRSIGAKVTLRGERMWSFFDRLINVALPRTRDFRGLSPDSFDGRGSYTLGIREQLTFPEIDYDNVTTIYGMDISIVTTAKTDEQGFQLLKQMDMPFRNQ